MKKPYLSIIISAYNRAQSLPTLLNSLFNSKFKDFEVIVVDDGSTDETSEVIKSFSKVIFFPIKNIGPGGARNFGAKKAAGEILVFFDADVVLFVDTLTAVAQAFGNKKTTTITGIWDKKQYRRDFFPRYKALRDWSYWHQEGSGNYSYMFSTRVGAIRKKFFWELKGFPIEKGANALEDFDFAYRLSEKYQVKFVSKFIVHHEFENFWDITVKFFIRSFKYTKLFLRYRKFSRNGYTPSEGIAGVTAILFLINLPLAFFWPFLWILAFFLLLIHLYLERKFLALAIKEEGLIFALKSIMAGWTVYLVVYSAASLSLLHEFCYYWLNDKAKV